MLVNSNDAEAYPKEALAESAARGYNVPYLMDAGARARSELSTKVVELRPQIPTTSDEHPAALKVARRKTPVQPERYVEFSKVSKVYATPSAPLTVVVLAAGKGTRMKSGLPKVLHPVAGRPLGAWSLVTAHEVGASPVIAVVGHEAEAVQEGLSLHAAEVRFALQAEQRGTGHAVQHGLEALSEDADEVLILYGDTPLLKAESLRGSTKDHNDSSREPSLKSSETGADPITTGLKVAVTTMSSVTSTVCGFTEPDRSPPQP